MGTFQANSRTVLDRQRGAGRAVLEFRHHGNGEAIAQRGYRGSLREMDQSDDGIGAAQSRYHRV